QPVVRVQPLLGELLQGGALALDAGAEEAPAPFVQGAGLDRVLVQVQSDEAHGGPLRPRAVRPPDRWGGPRLGRPWWKEGPNGNYLFELGAQPGGPLGWSDKEAGSEPIPSSDRPRGGTAPPPARAESLLVPRPARDRRTLVGQFGQAQSARRPLPL